MVSLCKLFGVTKQAFYKYVDHSTDSSARERFVLEFVKRVRSKDPGIGGMKLWLMYRNEFGTSQAFVGRDCFCAILSKYKLTIRKRFRAPRTSCGLVISLTLPYGCLTAVMCSATCLW